MLKRKRNIILGLIIVVASLLLVAGCGGGGGNRNGNGGGTSTVAFESVVQDGEVSETTGLTSLILTFSSDPTTLTADHITVTGATKGALSGTGTTRTLAISDITVGDGETISVAITNPPGFVITGSPKTVVVYIAFYIGRPYQGGKIAYILQPGDPGYIPGETHGFIAAIVDQSEGITWDNYEMLPTDAKGTALGTGQINTYLITAQIPDRNIAARVCYDYTNPDTGTGVYSDWFLPSMDELYKLYLNKTLIGGFADGKYWSSTEIRDSWAYSLDFSNGVWDSSAMVNYFRVRAVRSL